MAQETGERACDRCRERRVKCDKRHPSCLRCEKLGKPCPGYDKKRKFVDEGVTLRKKYQSEQNSPARPHSSISLQAVSVPEHAFPNTTSKTQISESLLGFDENNATTKQIVTGTEAQIHGYPLVPQSSSTSLNTTTSLLPFPHPLTENPLIQSENLPGEPWAEGTYDPEWFDLDPVAFYGSSKNACGFLPDVPNIVDEIDRFDVLMSTENSATPNSTALGTFSDSNVWAPESQLITSAIINDEREHEMAFLIRHFTESLAPWMDLFDQEKHFTYFVPLKALRDAMLRNAIAAVAAKQLGRMNGQRPFVPHQCQTPSATEVIDHADAVDWFYKAANYYDKAIAFSRQYLQAVSGRLSKHPIPPESSSSVSTNPDDLLVAVSLFSLYESLDNADIGWLQHLVGLKTLLTAVTTGDSHKNVGHQASFWNFARADYQAAYARNQRTLLDTDDFDLWQTRGLQVQPDGTLYESLESIKSESMHSQATIKLVAHTLLWLLLRVMNYVCDDTDNTRTETHTVRWNQLTRQLDSWHSNLPETYQPSAQVIHPQRLRTQRGLAKSSQLIEVFFSIDVCAASLQLYHFARILLLLHRPLSSDTGGRGSRLKAYREVSNEAIRHAHQIIGIALGRPHPAIRVEMLLPLFIAGSTLESDEEREIVLRLLRAMEKDTGCSTEARCQQLITDYWNWSQEPQGVA